MKILLDTHCWLWSLGPIELLNPTAQAAIASRANEVFLSSASSWEIAIKVAKGRLTLPQPPAEYIPSRLRAQGISSLPISHAHSLQAGVLPAHHRDPFDRMLVAQAKVEGWTLMTADPLLRAYEVRILWAGRGSP